MLLYIKETMNETGCMLKTSKNVLLVHGMLESVEKNGVTNFCVCFSADEMMLKTTLFKSEYGVVKIEI